MYKPYGFFAQKPFVPADLLLGDIDGSWYNIQPPYQSGNWPMYQTTAGLVAADDAGEPVGLLLPANRDGRGIVNKLVQTEDMSGSAWSKGAMVVTGALVDAATETASVYPNQAVTVSDFATYTLSASIAQGTAPWVRFRFPTAVNSLSGWVNTSTFEFGAGPSAGVSLVSAEPDPDNPGYTRVSVSVAYSSGAAGVRGFSISPVTADNSSTASGTVSVVDIQVNTGGAQEDYQANGPYLGGPGNPWGQSNATNRPTLQTTTINGRTVYYLSFTTDDYLSLGRPTLDDGVASFFADSSQTWAVGGVFSTFSTSGTVFGKGGATAGNRTLVFNLNGANSVAVFCRGTPTTRSIDVSDGAWHSWLLVWDGSTLTLYIDNSAGTAVAVGSAAEETSEIPLWGARTSSSPSSFFNGANNPLLMRAGLLSASEIAQWRNSVNSFWGIA